MVDLAKLVVKLEAQTAQYQKQLAQADKRTKRFEKRTKKSLSNISNSFKAALGGAAILGITRGVIRYADSWTNVTNKIKLATNGAEEQLKLQEQLFSLTQETRAPLAEISVLYQRMTLSANELGASQDDLLNITRGVSQALVVNGSTMAESRGVLLQFSQAIGSSIVRAEEFNSILEGGKPILIAVANNLDRAGGSVSKLRQLVLDGSITNKEFFDAFKKGLPELNEQFKKTSITVAQASIKIDNALTRLVGTELNASGGAKDLTDALQDLTDLLENPQTIKAFGQFSTMLITATAKIVAFSTATVGLFKFLGEELAAFTAGAAVGDMARLEEQLARLQTQAELTQNSILRRDPSANLQSSKFTYAQILRDIEATKEKIRVTQQLFDAEQKQPKAKPIAGVPDGAIPPPEITKEMKRQVKAILSMLEGLRSPMKEYHDSVAIANSLLAAGALKQIDYNNAIGHYQRTLSETTEEHKQWLQDLDDSTKFAEEAKTELELLEAEMDRVQELAGKGLLSPEAAERNIERINEEKEALSDMTDFAEEAARNLQDAFADFLFDPFAEGMDGMLAGFGKLLQKMVAEAIAADLLNAIGLGGKDNSGGNVASLVGGAFDFFGGFFADGGRPNPGKISVVGEEGPELFIPDGVSGSIIPNGARGGNPVQISSMVFPGVRTEKEAKIAAGAAARQISQLVDGGGRYN